MELRAPLNGAVQRTMQSVSQHSIYTPSIFPTSSVDGARISNAVPPLPVSNILVTHKPAARTSLSRPPSLLTTVVVEPRHTLAARPTVLGPGWALEATGATALLRPHIAVTREQGAVLRRIRRGDSPGVRPVSGGRGGMSRWEASQGNTEGRRSQCSDGIW